MFKTYHFKWAILLSVTFAVMGFLRQSKHFEFAQLGLLGEYIIFSFCNVISCWFIHHYFMLRSFKNLSNIIKGIISNIIAICVVLFLDYLLIVFNTKPLLADAPAFNNGQGILINFVTSYFLSVFIYIVVYNIYIDDKFQKSKLEMSC